MSSEEWTEKYRPQHLDEIVGHRKPLEELKHWAKTWEHGTPQEKAIILYGKAGVGKTTTAHALAKTFNWDVIELNASDTRTADIIEKVAGSASQMGTLAGTHNPRLIILDEADNLHGNADRGGANAIIRVIKNTNQPILLLANEYYDMSKSLRNSCKSIQFTGIRSPTIASFIKKIATLEHISIEPKAAETIAAHSNGDMRSAINDLQAIAEGKNELTMEDISVSLRDNKETIFQILSKIFKGSDVYESHQSTFQLDETPEDLIHWIDENLPLSYSDPHDLTRSFETLSRADLFLGRVRRRQNYRMWKHASLLMSGGISAAKTHHYSGYTRFQPPSRWRRLAQTKSMRNTRDSTALKIGTHCHVSKNFAKSELMGFMKLLIQSKEHSAVLAAELELSEDEIAYLLNSKPTAKKVKQIRESAQELIEKETEEDIKLFAGFTQEKTETSEKAEGKTKTKTAPKNNKIKKAKTKDTTTAGENTDEDNKPQSTLFDF